MKPPTSTAPTLLPARVDSAVLAKYRHPGEPLILVKLVGVGNSAPYDFHDKGTRSFIFRYESQQEGHILRVPLHLWQENKARLAHDIMDQRRLPHALIVTLDQPALTSTAILPADTEMGATDTRADARIVVGPGAVPTVAPTSGEGSGDRPQGDGRAACPQAAAAETPEHPDTPPTLTAQREVDSGNRPGTAAAIIYTTAATATILPASTSTTGGVAPPAESPALTSTLQADSPPLIAGRPLHEAAYDLVESPKRLKALAALLGVSEPDLRAAITHPASRIELATAGWVRRRA
jgi:hypothetical protein